MKKYYINFSPPVAAQYSAKSAKFVFPLLLLLRYARLHFAPFFLRAECKHFPRSRRTFALRSHPYLTQSSLPPLAVRPHYFIAAVTKFFSYPNRAGANK